MRPGYWTFPISLVFVLGQDVTIETAVTLLRAPAPLHRTAPPAPAPLLRATASLLLRTIPHRCSSPSSCAVHRLCARLCAVLRAVRLPLSSRRRAPPRSAPSLLSAAPIDRLCRLHHRATAQCPAPSFSSVTV
ncbi:hypothetical protein U1Q18_046024 [Sarracenia purpurea var. burkii]